MRTLPLLQERRILLFLPVYRLHLGWKNRNTQADKGRKIRAIQRAHGMGVDGVSKAKGTWKFKGNDQIPKQGIVLRTVYCEAGR